MSPIEISNLYYLYNYLNPLYMRTVACTITMDNAKKMDTQFAMILENLEKLGDGNNEKLPSIEKYVQDKICALLDVDTSIREIYRKMFTCDDEELKLSGSVVEGAMLARCFQTNEDWNEIELDMMRNLFTIYNSFNCTNCSHVIHLLEPVEDKPGFVRIPFHQELFSEHFYTFYTEDILGISKNASSSLDQIPEYINPLLIREYIKDHNDGFMNRILRIMDSFFLGQNVLLSIPQMCGIF